MDWNRTLEQEGQARATKQARMIIFFYNIGNKIESRRQVSCLWIQE